MRLFAAICLLVFSAFTAHADSFVITSGSGSAGVGPLSSDLEFLVSAPGFSMGARTHSFSTRINPLCPCGPSNAPSGGFISLSAYDGALNYTDLSGGFTINGVSYPLSNVGVFSIVFTTSQILPSFIEPLIDLTMPFEFSAQFHSGPAGNFVTAYASGSGLASVTLYRTAMGYYMRQGPVSYTFDSPPQQATQHMPEPMSLILLGSGLAMIARKLRTRRCAYCNSKKWHKDMWPARWICAECGQDLKLTGKF